MNGPEILSRERQRVIDRVKQGLFEHREEVELVKMIEQCCELWPQCVVRDRCIQIYDELMEAITPIHIRLGYIPPNPRWDVARQREEGNGRERGQRG